MTFTSGLVVLAPWGACALLWRRRWFGWARAAAAIGTLILAFIAAYFWQAYDNNWAMAVPFAVGMIAVSACGTAKGEGSGAVGRAFVVVGIPILFMLLTFNYFTKMFLLIRADAASGKAVGIEEALQAMPQPRRDAATASLIGALAGDDLFVKWGALHRLWLGGPVAAAAAEEAARAVISTNALAPSAPREYMRRDGIHFLGSLGQAGGPALLLILREGDADLRSDALDAIGRVGPPLKDAALPELVKLSAAGEPNLSYPLQRTRKDLGISDEEWRQAGGK
ncbi:MAG: hypothetical protein WCU88_05055 [Elusimicrobiota bacterium]|jgi:hypothetical protein